MIVQNSQFDSIEKEKKNVDTLNEENSQNVIQPQNENNEEIQNKENYKSDEKEFSKNNKSHQISQIIEEEQSDNLIINQENLLSAKKYGEDQSIPIPFHSDLTLKKKIHRNLTKIEFFQNASFQVFNINEVQNAIIIFQNKENTISHQYLSTSINQEDISKQQINRDQNSQTQTIRKGKQNNLYLMKNQGDSSNQKPIIQKQEISNIILSPNSLKKQQQFLDQNKCLEDIAELPNNQLSIEKKLSEIQQYLDNQQKKNTIFDNQIIEDKKNLNDIGITDNQNQDIQQNKERISYCMSKSDQPQPSTSTLYENQIKTKQLQIEEQLTITYASQIEKIINQIKEFNIKGNDLDQEKFENINEIQIESCYFT
ncbi:hypothetical protein ABPG74_013573 [Tetrahymena malaccensis]